MPAKVAPVEPQQTTFPDALGRFGAFGGRFVPETLMDALNQLSEAYEEARNDPAFVAKLDDYWANYVGRPSPLFFAERLTKQAGGADIYLKREDLNHTGAHKINNAIGQVDARPAHGQDPRDRRDRRGAARRGDGDRVPPSRPGMCRLHGRARTSAARSSTSSTCGRWARRSSP